MKIECAVIERRELGCLIGLIKNFNNIVVFKTNKLLEAGMKLKILL